MDGRAMEGRINMQMAQEWEHRKMDGYKGRMDQKMDGSFFGLIKRV